LHTTPKNKNKYKAAMEVHSIVKVRSSKIKIFSKNDFSLFVLLVLDNKTRPVCLMSENNSQLILILIV